MDGVFAVSIIAAFLAGVVALFAPCCVTVLLPAYLASAARARTRLIAMTAVFFAGVAVVLVPIGLGAAALASIFSNYHRELYLVGGVLMLVFAVLAIAERGIPFLPMAVRTRLSANHSGSVFLLGVFSGAATSCCAPVLAGVVTLSVLAGAFWKSLIVSLAYVFGITFPLFLAALFYDRFAIEKSRFIEGRVFSWSLFGRSMTTHSTNVLAAAMFAAVGAMLIFLALSGNAFWAPSWQGAIGSYLQRISTVFIEVLERTSVVVRWGVLLVAVSVLLSAFRGKKYDR